MALEPTSSGSNRPKHPDLWMNNYRIFGFYFSRIAIAGLSDDSP